MYYDRKFEEFRTNYYRMEREYFIAKLKKEIPNGTNQQDRKSSMNINE